MSQSLFPASGLGEQKNIRNREWKSKKTHQIYNAFNTVYEYSRGGEWHACGEVAGKALPVPGDEGHHLPLGSYNTSLRGPQSSMAQRVGTGAKFLGLEF